jgi:hypothetical protein
MFLSLYTIESLRCCVRLFNTDRALHARIAGSINSIGRVNLLSVFLSSALIVVKSVHLEGLRETCILFFEPTFLILKK